MTSAQENKREVRRTGDVLAEHAWRSFHQLASSCSVWTCIAKVGHLSLEKGACLTSVMLSAATGLAKVGAFYPLAKES